MTYVASVTLPIVFDAISDDQARLIMEHIEDVLALHVTLPHGAEISDAPDVVLQASEMFDVYDAERDVWVPRRDLRIIYTETDFMARQAPVEPGSAGDCDVCRDFEANTNREVY